MQAVMRWLWVLILVLGLTCLLFGTMFIMMGRSMSAEGLESYSRSEGVNTWEDVEARLDMFKAQKEAKEDEFEGYGTAPDYKIRSIEEGIYQDKVLSGTVLSLYGGSPRLDVVEEPEMDELVLVGKVGNETKYVILDGEVGIGYMESMDGMSAMGLGMMMMGMSRLMTFSGILSLVIGIGFVLSAIVTFRIGHRMNRTDKALSELVAK